MPLSKKRPETFTTILPVMAQGVTEKLRLVYNNWNEDVLKEKLEGKTLGEFLLELIVEWDAEYALTPDGLKEAERDIPDFLECLLAGFNIGRKASIAKN